MPYALSKNTWTKPIIEKYEAPVTLSLNEWKKYISKGKHILYVSGGVIPGGIMTTAFGNSGAVYRGNVGRRY